LSSPRRQATRLPLQAKPGKGGLPLP
jgi:hypothetical protein